MVSAQFIVARFLGVSEAGFSGLLDFSGWVDPHFRGNDSNYRDCGYILLEYVPDGHIPARDYVGEFKSVGISQEW